MSHPRPNPLALNPDARRMRALAAQTADPRFDLREMQRELFNSEKSSLTSRITPAPGQIMADLTPEEYEELDGKIRRLNIGSYEQRIDADSRFRSAQEEAPPPGTIVFNLTTTRDGRTANIPVEPVNIVELRVGSFLFPHSIVARLLEDDPEDPPNLLQVERRHPFFNDLVRLSISVMRNTAVEKAFFDRYHFLFRVHRHTDPQTVGDNTATPSSTLMVRLVPEIDRIIFNSPIEINGAFPCQFLDAFWPIPLNQDRFPIFSGVITIVAGPAVLITLIIDDPEQVFDFVVGERVNFVQENGQLFRPEAPLEPWGYTIATITRPPPPANPIVTITAAPPPPFANTGSATINPSDGAFLLSIDRQINIPFWFRSVSEVETNYMTLISG